MRVVAQRLRRTSHYIDEETGRPICGKAGRGGKSVTCVECLDELAIEAITPVELIEICGKLGVPIQPIVDQARLTGGIADLPPAVVAYLAKRAADRGKIIKFPGAGDAKVGGSK